MRLNAMIIMCCLLVWGSSCNSLKTTQKANTNIESASNAAEEKVEKVMTETKAAVVKNKAEKPVKMKREKKEEVKKEESRVVKKVANKAEEVKKEENDEVKKVANKAEEVKKEVEKVANKTEDMAEKTATNTTKRAADTPLKKVNVKDIKTNKTKVGGTKKAQAQQTAMIGKYKWLKRVCCGRMQKVTLPEEGQESFMTFTEDGKVLYSGHAMKNAKDTNYKLEMNSRTFPERPMLKMDDKIPALMHFKGDTLVIDRGYIDLDKTYWLKVE